jgi:exosortase H (IPTLxxWG-CTERM-specific)
MLRFLAIFLVVLLGLFTLDIYEPVAVRVIDPFNGVLAWLAAHGIGLFGGDALAQGKVLATSQGGFAVSIERVCNGVEAVIILVAAIMAFPAPWKNKLLGVVIGTLAIQVLNIVRIISLFYLGQWDRQWFEWFHLYLWQALIVLDALVVFLLWLRSLPAPARTDARTPAEKAPA